MKNKLILMLLEIVLLILLVGFVYADIIWSDGTLTEFEITSTEPVCEGGAIWKEWISGEWTEKGSIYDCYREDSEGNPMTCCPDEGEPECNLDDPLSDDFGTCTGLPMPRYCSGYTLERYDGDEDLARKQCKGATFAIANRSMVDYSGIDNICRGYIEEGDGILAPEECSRFTLDCGCEWDDVDKICRAEVSRSNWICPGDIDIIIDEKCSFAEIGKEDDCENSGYIFYSWESAWEDGGSERPDWCADGSRKFRCAAKLSFFTITTLIIALIAIIIIYYIWIKKKQKKKQKK